MILEIIFWVLLVDSLIAGSITWCGNKEKWNRMSFFKRYMPLTKGWTAWYVILVLIIGYAIYFA